MGRQVFNCKRGFVNRDKQGSEVSVNKGKQGIVVI